MISTAEALAHLFALAEPRGTEAVPLSRAAGRVLAEEVVAWRAQPPFSASAMDGYAVRSGDIAPGARLRVIGEAPAGKSFGGSVGSGEAVRIFTGAPIPEGADRIVIQEDTVPFDGGIEILGSVGAVSHVRPAGGDFKPGDRVLAPRRLSPADIALFAAMNVPAVTVRRKPVVALIATGSELVQPGETPRDDQIIASNALGLKALLDAAGAESRILPIARDTAESLRTVLSLTGGADLVVVIGGASVGDYDLVGDVARDLGMARAFYKVAMRPGKPLMAGRLNGTPLVGLPGNPVSSMVCGYIFLLPMIRRMLGFPARAATRSPARLGCDLPENGPREHYMRAWLQEGRITPFDNQDSSLLSVLNAANALLVRPPHDPGRETDAPVDAIILSAIDAGAEHM